MAQFALSPVSLTYISPAKSDSLLGRKADDDERRVLHSDSELALQERMCLTRENDIIKSKRRVADETSDSAFSKDDLLDNKRYEDEIAE